MEKEELKELLKEMIKDEEIVLLPKFHQGRVVDVEILIDGEVIESKYM